MADGLVPHVLHLVNQDLLLRRMEGPVLLAKLVQNDAYVPHVGSIVVTSVTFHRTLRSCERLWALVS